MRRFLFFIGILLPIFFLSACENAVQLSEPTLILEFMGEADVKSNDIRMKATVKRDKDGLIQIDVTEPESLKGLIIKHSGTESSISKGELSYKTDSIPLPNSSAIVAIVDILEYMANNSEADPFFKDDKEMGFIGKIDVGKFELKADKKTGLIKEIKVGEEILIQFSNQSKL